jgi:hypothetical protein
MDRTRRKSRRYRVMQVGDWDFFTRATGAKAAFIENLSDGGCLLRTREPIEHRRWIRLMIRDSGRNVCFAVVGRVLRREDRMEAWDDHDVTLHRFGVEFTTPLNAVATRWLADAEQACRSLLRVLDL